MRSADGDLTGVSVADASQPGFPLSFVSPGFERMTGYRASEALGRSCSFLQGPDTDPAAVDVLRGALAAQREAYVLLLNYRADGSAFWNEIALVPRFRSDGRLYEYLGIQKDVSNRREAEARVRELTYTDATTGLANRAALHDELDAAGREGTDAVLVLAQLTRWREQVLPHGERVADALLRAASGRIAALARSADVVARAGESEFGLLVRGFAPGEGPQVAAQLAERATDVLGRPFNLDGTRLECTWSVGSAVMPRDGSDSEAVLRRARAG